MKKNVIIISVPFQRLIRNLLGAPILEVIQNNLNTDIIIVSPFSNNQAFQKEFGNTKTFFLNWKAPVELKQPNGFLFTIVETLRVNGFWRKYKNSGMRAYLANNEMRFGIDGDDVYFSWPKKLLFNFLSLVGMFDKAWLIFLKLIPKPYFKIQELDNILTNYQNITLIQSANWGLQDHMLAWKARKKDWKKIMIPYTIDQLFANGYLLNDFNFVCVQGLNEFNYASFFHKISEKKIIKLGSAWFTNMEFLIKKRSFSRLEKQSKKYILYTGCSNQFFPSESEYEGLEKILSELKNGLLNDSTVIYRPLGESEERKNEIVKRFGNSENLVIEFAQQACFGLSEFDNQMQEEQLLNHISQISKADIVVMCFATSIAHDASFLGIPSVINLVDNAKVIERRNVHHQIDENGHFRLFEGIPVAHNYNTLFSEISKLISDQEYAKRQVDTTVKNWHFNNQDFKQKLSEILQS